MHQTFSQRSVGVTSEAETMLTLTQGSRLRLKRSPKILICEWSFCWGRHWRLYIFTCYDLKMCMQCLFSWLFCDHIFCYIHVLNLKLKDDAHQSFSGKRASNSPRLCRTAALTHTVCWTQLQLCSAREIEMTETCKCRKAVSISCTTWTNYNR